MSDSPLSSTDPRAVTFRGQPVNRIVLGPSITIGRTQETDITLADGSVSRQHAVLERSGNGYRVRDLGSKTGSLINGRLFEQQELVYGDVLQVGPFCFRFDGSALVRSSQTAGGRVQSMGVVRQAGPKTLLHSIDLEIEPGHFVGILGTSGAGKSTLLNVLSGLQHPEGGKVLIDGVNIYQGNSTAMCGYVPQDDIVHGELTVEDALRYSAAMRLPGSIANAEIEKAVKQTLSQLRLEQRAAVRVASLSGGQRKRVSIGAELIARPPVLFLDEPSSGLDPATEFALMELLRQLANTGCSIICTTHVMENVFLMDEVVVVSGGRLVFNGPPRDVLTHFGIQRFSALYERLEERPAAEWQALYTPAPRPAGPPAMPALPAAATVRDAPPYFSILLRRQWSLLSSNGKNFAMLVGQPLLVALLVTAMANDNPALKLFLAWLATFWFGCGNAAEDIVGEIPIYRRERIVGLGRHNYLLMKFVFFGVITALQSLLFYLVISLGGADGSAFWQLLSLMGTSLSAVAVGFAISAWVKTKTQAVRMVPLILLPQIIFSGFVLQLPKGAKSDIAAMIPAYSSQRMMDVSLLTGRNKTKMEQQLTVVQMSALAGNGSMNLSPEAKEANNAKIALRNLKDEPADSNGIYHGFFTAFGSLIKLTLWGAIGYVIAFLGLRSREKGA